MKHGGKVHAEMITDDDSDPVRIEALELAKHNLDIH